MGIFEIIVGFFESIGDTVYRFASWAWNYMLNKPLVFICFLIGLSFLIIIIRKILNIIVSKNVD